MLARYTRETIPLSDKVYRTQQLSQGYVDQAVNSALGRGLSARELAKEVRDLIRPDTPGGVSYAAMRLARTEINAANKYASETDNAEKPFVDSIEWKLSLTHPKKEKDICDRYAEDSPYPKDEVPATPHPQCLCYQVPKVLDEDEFIKNLQGGDYDKYLSDKYGIDDEFPAEREKVALAPVAQIIDRQPKPEKPKPAAPKRLDVAQAAWHSGRLLKGAEYDALPDDIRNDLINVTVNMLEGLPEKKVAALRAIRVGGIQLSAGTNQRVNAEYDPEAREIRLSDWIVRNGRSKVRTEDNPGWYSDTGSQAWLQGTLNHEMGHHLDMITTRNSRLDLYAAMREVDPNWQAKPPQIGDEFGIDYNDLNTEHVVMAVGTYASTNKWELIAELYAEFRGDKAEKSALAKAVGKLLHRDLEEE